jgi:hypothetical protein
VVVLKMSMESFVNGFGYFGNKRDGEICIKCAVRDKLWNLNNFAEALRLEDLSMIYVREFG